MSFENKEFEQRANQRISQLRSLSDFENQNKLVETVLKEDYGSDGNGSGATNDNPDLDPWRGFYSCAGSYSVPFLIRKINTSKFDLAYFAEVSKGNGDTYGYPKRTLVINKNNDWIILKDEQKIFNFKNDGTVKSWPGCPVGQLSKEELKCDITLWAKKYRNETENQKWIQQTLNNILLN